ncbi:hypothetical protein OS493_016955 [Desmophyllum pertusum]|uniref:Uncharacterized protein n=1 Tax=Desmophyllum pertusum TaxID=174260 RepID=A0A9X0CLY0_9CNID|nr:hypothetical protein OS493_016955 [Desmophyllum pertusum]
MTYCNIGEVYKAVGDYQKSCEYLEKSLQMNKKPETDEERQLPCIKNHQSTRDSLKDETHKLSLDGQDFSCYKTLSWLLLRQGKFNDALFTLELGRGRALVDLISQKYGIQGTPETSEVTSKKELSFIAMLQNIIALWFVDKSGNIKFKVGLEIELPQEKKSYVAEDFGVDFSRSVLEDQEVQCENRSLSALYEDGLSAATEQNKRSKKQGVRKGEGNQSYVEVQFTQRRGADFVESSQPIDMRCNPDPCIYSFGAKDIQETMILIKVVIFT